jgi:hypothetical protein
MHTPRPRAATRCPGSLFCAPTLVENDHMRHAAMCLSHVTRCPAWSDQPLPAKKYPANSVTRDAPEAPPIPPEIVA